jgi:hypothetical protein
MNWSLVVACNSDEVLRGTLLRSPDVQPARHLLIQKGFNSASSAYNDGIRRTESEIIVFPHQDVFLPAGFGKTLCKNIERLTAFDPEWGVAGVYGVTGNGGSVGHVYSTGLRRFVGAACSRPAEVRTLDEMLLILRRSAGLHFDGGLPGFHLYGTDICLEASRRGFRSYVLPCFCIHNSNGIRLLPWSYWECYLYMRRKWRHKIPIITPGMSITPWGGGALRYLFRASISLMLGLKVGSRTDNPAELFRQLATRQTESAASLGTKL